MVLRQRLTVLGYIGIGFFLVGPLYILIGFSLTLHGISFVPDAITVIAAFCDFISFPMLLLGREWVSVKD